RRHLGLSEHHDDRQPDQPVLPGRPSAHRRRMPRRRALGPARSAHVVLPVVYRPRLAGGDRGSSVRDWWANPWGQPRTLAVVTWLYMVWAIVPVGIAILFSFNDGRSRSVWQGFSTRWYWGDPNLSVA